MRPQGRVRRSPCPGPWRRESDVPLHVRRARTHRRPARTPGHITSVPPAMLLGARRASVTHRCPNARSRTRRDTRLPPLGVPPVLPSRRSRPNGVFTSRIRDRAKPQAPEFRKRLKGLIFGFLIQLQDLGIISDASLGMSMTLGSSQPGEFKQALISYNRVLLATHKDEKKELRLDSYRLTSLGKQVLKLGSFTPNEIYLRSVGETIKRQGFKVSLAHFAHLTETKGRYFDGEAL